MTDSLIPITDEQAKLGQEILKTFRGLGSFLERALGSTPEDFGGALGDILGRPFAPTADRQQQGGLTPIGFCLAAFARSRADSL